MPDRFWDRIHPILSDAMRRTEEADWPDPPHRGDGPAPKLALREQLAMAISGPQELRALGSAILYRTPREPLFDVARHAVFAAHGMALGGSHAKNDVNRHARLGAQAMVDALDEDRAAIRAVLVELDGAILARELSAMLAERAVVPSAPVAEVRFRAAIGAAKTAPGLFW